MRERWLAVAALLIFLAIIVGAKSRFSAESTVHPDSVSLDILNVGQGDSILIDTPDRQEILVDGGPDATVLTRLAQEMPPGDKEINLVISTHNDADHLSGLNSVLDHYQVDKIWLTGATDGTQTYKKFVALVAAKHVPTEKVKLGSEIAFGALRGIVVSPSTNYDGVLPDQQNVTGIVTFWQFGQETFLLTADIEAPQEQEILSRHLLPHVDILKVAHHGSHTSSTEEFLTAIMPKVAAISVGKNNRYGHPHQDVLDRFQALHIPVLRTDQDGTIRFNIFKDHLTYETNA